MALAAREKAGAKQCGPVWLWEYALFRSIFMYRNLYICILSFIWCEYINVNTQKAFWKNYSRVALPTQKGYLFYPVLLFDGF